MYRIFHENKDWVVCTVDVEKYDFSFYGQYYIKYVIRKLLIGKKTIGLLIISRKIFKISILFVFSIIVFSCVINDQRHLHCLRYHLRGRRHKRGLMVRREKYYKL